MLRQHNVDEPRRPRRVRWWNSLRATIAGRRDARSATVPTSAGESPSRVGSIKQTETGPRNTPATDG